MSIYSASGVKQVECAHAKSAVSSARRTAAQCCRTEAVRPCVCSPLACYVPHIKSERQKLMSSRVLNAAAAFIIYYAEKQVSFTETWNSRWPHFWEFAFAGGLLHSGLGSRCKMRFPFAPRIFRPCCVDASSRKPVINNYFVPCRAHHAPPVLFYQTCLSEVRCGASTIILRSHSFSHTRRLLMRPL